MVALIPIAILALGILVGFAYGRFYVKPEVIKESVDIDQTIPEDWFVYECGQSPLHLKWFVQIIYFPDFAKYNEVNHDDEGNELPKDMDPQDIRRVYVEECDSLNEALSLGIKEIEENFKIIKPS